MIKNAVILSLLILVSVILKTDLYASEDNFYHLGPIKVERIGIQEPVKNVLKFNVYNTTGMAVRYFSITCKIIKEGYLIDERTVNGFGIEAKSFKEIRAQFLWLPDEYDIDFEVNKIRTEGFDIVHKESPSQRINRPELLETKIYFQEPEKDPMDFIDNKWDSGKKYQLYNNGTWFPNN